MDRAVHGLILRREQGFDLVVGRVDRAGAAGFVGALAAEDERGFGKRCALRAVDGWCWVDIRSSCRVPVVGARPTIAELMGRAHLRIISYDRRPRLLAGAEQPIMVGRRGPCENWWPAGNVLQRTAPATC